MPDSEHKRLLYISLIGFGAIVPLAVGMYPAGAIVALMSVGCVAIYIREDRQRELAKPGFPVLMKEPGLRNLIDQSSDPTTSQNSFNIRACNRRNPS